MDDIALFWERLNSLIKKSNTTQASVSVQCGMNPRRLQNLSAGNRLPDAFEAFHIAKTLKTTVEYLVTGEQQPISLPQDLQDVINKYALKP